MSYDISINNGIIVDGTGNPWYKGNIAIKNGYIADISRHRKFKADVLIDASGLIVAPGFIDMHSHSDYTLLVNPYAESKIMQGVTTEVIGNCGSSAAPVKGEIAIKRMKRRLKNYGLNLSWRSFGEYLELLQRQGISINIAPLVGHGQIRICVMGYEARAPTENELEEMKKLLDESLKMGAFGMSTGLVYPPGRFAKTEEIIELCKVISKYDGLYATHIRGERETIVEAVKEAVKIAEKAKVKLQISHHPAKIGGWGKSKITLKIIEEARSRGVDVACDLHPYIAGSTGLSTLLPPWVQEGGLEKIMERLRDFKLRKKIIEDMIEEPIPGPGPCGLVKRNMWDKIILVSCKRNRVLTGKSIKEIAELRGIDPFNAYFDLLLEEETAGSIIGFYYNEDDIRRVLLHQCSMIGSDGYAISPKEPFTKSMPHPRSYGTFPMIIRKYVKGVKRNDLWYDSAAKILRLEDAVRKMTSLPAQRLGLHDRGLIEKGFWADIVIFDFANIMDTATYLHPHSYSKGIKYVIINGDFAVFEGKHTYKKIGKVLNPPFSLNK